ncbi:MAG: ZIP family metal transporter [Sulfurihydrogenibium sp.]|nr:MAG: ZIP family metal transporter [Sulfurihydrogenibium sp.]
MNLNLLAISGSFLAGVATVLGAFPILLGKRISPKMQDVFLGFSGGIMLAASFFSLLNPAIDMANVTFNRYFAVALVSLGLILGTFIFLIVDRFIPEDYFLRIYENGNSKILKKMWLFIFAITVHNFPEGMSSALGFLTGDFGKGISLATGIGIQNIPEGLAVAMALYVNNFPKKDIFLITFLTGIVEPVGGLVAILLFSISHYILPIGLAFAAGAMLFVVTKEMIPEIHKRGYETQATLSLIFGFIFMMLLDNLFS